MIRYWKFSTGYSPTRPPRRLEAAPEHHHVPRLVPALAGDGQAQLPVRVGEVGEVAGRDLQAVDLLVHLPVQELQRVPGVLGRDVVHLRPALAARRSGASRAGPSANRRGSSGSRRGSGRGSRERKPAWRRISWISSSVNSASRRSSTFTAGTRSAGSAERRAHRVDLARRCDWSARVGVGQEAHGGRDLQQHAAVLLDHGLDPAVGEADVLDLVGQDGLEDLGRAPRRRPRASPAARLPTTSIAPASNVRFWVARRPGRLSSAQVTFHSKTEMGNSPLRPPSSRSRRARTATWRDSSQHCRASSRRSSHGASGNSARHCGGDVEAGDLVGHVAVHHLPQGPRVRTVVLVHLGVAAHHVEAGVARRRLAQRERARGWK